MPPSKIKPEILTPPPLPGDSHLRAAFLRRSADQRECTGLLIEGIIKCRSLTDSTAEVIWNTATHVNLLSHDNLVLMTYAGLEDDDWACATLARMLATTIYEGIEDLKTLFLSNFGKACRDLGIFYQIKPEYETSRRSLKEFARAHEDLLKQIRMCSGAHRDHDCIAFLRHAALGEELRILEISSRFDFLLNELAQTCQTAIDLLKAAAASTPRAEARP